MLKSNVAACCVKMGEWKEAVARADEGLDALGGKEEQQREKGGEEAGQVVELEGDEREAEERLEELKERDERRERVAKLRAKLLMRRARANTELGGWANLAAAETGKLASQGFACRILHGLQTTRNWSRPTTLWSLIDVS